jgi:hypothetical protein
MIEDSEYGFCFFLGAAFGHDEKDCEETLEIVYFLILL